MSKIKVFNDPIYGLISFPFELIYELIDHRYFQRLRRISQVGLSSLVYPGATHTRFHHALGVTHLCSELIRNLIVKGVEITDEEYEATCAAALLHDIGHGPFSHALEHMILPIHHEKITIMMMQLLNSELDNRLSLAIEIFEDRYPKKFLHQILSSQLDVDRMDYLSRDSYYSGVAEGVIGYDRIVKMMNVHQNNLVIEEKGLYSVDKFFMSRHLMYRQVYLHKTAVGAESMLVAFFKEFRKTINNKNIQHELIKNLLAQENNITKNTIDEFANLDDHDIYSILKTQINSKNFICRYMAEGILNRRLLRTFFSKEQISSDFIESIRLKAEKLLGINSESAAQTICVGMDSHKIYDTDQPIHILSKSGNIKPYSSLMEINSKSRSSQIHFISYPKEIDIYS